MIYSFDSIIQRLTHPGMILTWDKKKTQRCQGMSLGLFEGGVWFLQVGEMTYVQ